MVFIDPQNVLASLRYKRIKRPIPTVIPPLSRSNCHMKLVCFDIFCFYNNYVTPLVSFPRIHWNDRDDTRLKEIHHFLHNRMFSHLLLKRFGKALRAP